MNKEKLFCSECNEEVSLCDVCMENFDIGDEVICHNFEHIHKQCIYQLESEIIAEDDRFEEPF